MSRRCCVAQGDAAWPEELSTLGFSAASGAVPPLEEVLVAAAAAPRRQLSPALRDNAAVRSLAGTEARRARAHGLTEEHLAAATARRAAPRSAYSRC